MIVSLLPLSPASLRIAGAKDKGGIGREVGSIYVKIKDNDKRDLIFKRR